MQDSGTDCAESIAAQWFRLFFCFGTNGTAETLPLPPKEEEGERVSPGCHCRGYGMSRSGCFSGNPPTAGIVVAESRGWSLYRLPGNGAWVSLKLVAKTRQPKANFHLGWNGERLAAGKDAATLSANYPDVFDWVVAELGSANGQ